MTDLAFTSSTTQIHWLIRQSLFANNLQNEENIFFDRLNVLNFCLILRNISFLFSQILGMCLQGICNCHLHGNNIRRPKYQAAVRREVDCSNLLNYLFSLSVTLSWNPLRKQLGMYTWAGPNREPCHRAASKDTEAVSCHGSLSLVSALHYLAL